MSLTETSLISMLKQQADSAHALKVQGYFKTAEDEYGAGDQFLGWRMRQLRALTKHAVDLGLNENSRLL